MYFKYIIDYPSHKLKCFAYQLTRQDNVTDNNKFTEVLSKLIEEKIIIESNIYKELVIQKDKILKMKKVYLNKNCKRILLELYNNKYDQNNYNYDKDKKDLIILKDLGFIDPIEGEFVDYTYIILSEKGKEYITMNPKLKNPPFWENADSSIDKILHKIYKSLQLMFNFFK